MVVEQLGVCEVLPLGSCRGARIIITRVWPDLYKNVNLGWDEKIVEHLVE